VKNKNKIKKNVIVNCSYDRMGKKNKELCRRKMQPIKLDAEGMNIIWLAKYLGKKIRKDIRLIANVENKNPHSRSQVIYS
jgi:hypothetical protein